MGKVRPYVSVTKSAKTYTATEARAQFSDLCDAAYFGARVLITKRDREVAIVSVKFLDRADKLLEMEAAIEAKAAFVRLAK